MTRGDPSSSKPREPRTTLRLSFFYWNIFLVIGIHLPFWPVWLASRGLKPPEIGLLVASAIGVKVLASPLVAEATDRAGQRRRPMIALATLSLATFALFGLADGFWTILVVTLVFFAVWSPIMPLGESLTMLSAKKEGSDYGRVRLWGSLSFIVAAVLAGRALVGRPEDLIYWLLLATLGMSVFACHMPAFVRRVIL